MASGPLPVTVLSGFLGSGKTTLLKRILEQREGLKVAVIVNDMSEINIDAQLVKQGSTLKQVDEKMVEMQNGCICCTLREDLVTEVRDLAKEGKFDYLVVESTGISEPIAVAEAFAAELSEEKYGMKMLSDVARLDTLVTVVDAANFNFALESVENVSERNVDVPKEDERTIAHLMVDQVECADVLIINKTDKVDEETLQRIRGILRKLNPDSKVLESQYSNVPLKEVLNTGRYDVDRTAKTPGWMQDLQDGNLNSKTPETVEYGITSFAYRRRRPFHPKKIHEFLQGTFMGLTPALVRSKGFIWIASRHNTMAQWSSAGRTYELDAAQDWLSCCSQSAYPEDPKLLKQVVELTDGHPFIGDRRQEIVFIGTPVPQKDIEDALDSCLVTEEEFEVGPAGWQEFEDPLPEWEEEDHHHHGGSGANAGGVLTAALVMLETGEVDEALPMLKELRFQLEYNIACCHAKQGRAKQALRHVATAVQLGLHDVGMLETDPDLTEVRELPEYRRVLNRVRRLQAADEAAAERKNTIVVPVSARPRKVIQEIVGRLTKNENEEKEDNDDDDESPVTIKVSGVGSIVTRAIQVIQESGGVKVVKIQTGVPPAALTVVLELVNRDALVSLDKDSIEEEPIAEEEPAEDAEADPEEESGEKP